MEHLTNNSSMTPGTDHRMTLATRPCIRGPLVSVEGVTGVGKNYLIEHAVRALHEQPVVLGEFSAREQGPSGLGDKLLRALREANPGDPFLLEGNPKTEALLLLAIKRHDLDISIPNLTRGRTVVEGRSVDATAVCQAVLLHPHDPDAALETAKQLLQFASSYRPLPDLTILVTDDASQAITRAQRRDRYDFTPDQATFMYRTAALYEQLAATDPKRYRVIDRRRVTEHEATQMIRSWIRETRSGLRCIHEPWEQATGPCLCCRTPQQ